MCTRRAGAVSAEARMAAEQTVRGSRLGGSNQRAEAEARISRARAGSAEARRLSFVII